ncbi:MAG: class I SAM-dependent methyltransferase [Ferruginibacter sp.]|nr:class I SAM-dependent methyltransferase [Ferruginibacter sp.]
MKESLINYLSCPVHHDDLHLLKTTANEYGEILEGKLISSNGIEYLINNGIPNLIPMNSVSINTDANQNVYKTVSESYVSILHKFGIDSRQIAQMDSLRFAIFSKTKNLCNTYLSGVVLEIGAGGNHLKEDFKSMYGEWISLDYDLRSDSIDLRGDGQQLPFKNEMFDTIISIDVLEHVPNPEKFVAEMFRVIKPGGTVILSTPFFFYLHEEPFDFFRFSKYGLRTIFERHGFKVIDVIPIAGVIAIIGLLISIFVTRVFRFSRLLLKFFLKINRLIQLKLLLPIDNRIDKKKKFAQGHFIIAKKEI